MSALTESTLALIETEGTDVTIRDISNRANVPHSLVARYFGSKEGLISEAIATTLPDDVELAGSLDCVVDAAGTAFDSVLERPERIRILAQLLNGGAAPREIRSEAPILETLVRLVEEQCPDVADPRVTAAAIGALSMGWLLVEDYLIEHTGLADEDRDEVRAQVRALLPRLH